jgi:hypothetical protein
MEINIEVLREVLGKDISEFSILGNTLNYVTPNYETEEDGELFYIDLGTNINIDELIKRCKVWAIQQDYDNNCFITIIYEDLSARAIITEDGFGITRNTELEAVFAICEYLLGYKKKGI